jgi:transposase
VEADLKLTLGGSRRNGGLNRWTPNVYPSDLTDEEWWHIEPLIPPAKRGGRKRSVEPREIVNGLMYVLSTGCQWRYVPKDLPPKSTLFDYFDLWNWDRHAGSHSSLALREVSRNHGS